MRHADRPTVTESIEVPAPPERVWPLVSDIALPVGVSAELQSVRWADDDIDSRPRAGRRFVGRNANRYFGEWETVATVVECDEPRTFAWDVGDLGEPNTRWRFTLEPVDGGTRVTQWGQLGFGPSGLHHAIAAMPDKEERIVERRCEEFRVGMRANLEAIRRAVGDG